MEDEFELLDNVIGDENPEEIEEYFKECIEQGKHGQGKDVNRANGQGWTLLHYAVEMTSSLSKDKRLEIVKLLLERGANPNNKNDDGNTPVHSAFNYAEAEILKLFFDNDQNPADLTIENDEGKKPTDIETTAYITFLVKMQELKLEYGNNKIFNLFFDPTNEKSILSRFTNLKESESDNDSKKLEPLDLLGLSYLLDIIKKNQGYEKLEDLLANLKESKSYVDSKELEAFRQSIERMKFLYETYYDPQKTLDELYKIDDQEKQKELYSDPQNDPKEKLDKHCKIDDHKKIRGCFIKVFEELCELGKKYAEINLDNIAEAKLALSIANASKIEDISTLLKKLLAVYEQSVPKLLKDAICKGDLKTVRELFANGANPNTPDQDGKMPLYNAGLNIEMIEVLLEHGADPTRVLNISNGYTIFHEPAKERKPEILTRLFAKVKEYLAKGDRNDPLLDAESRIQIAETTVRELLNTKDKDGNTALHLAIKNVENYKKAETAEILLANGADPNMPDKDENTALHLAILNMICHPFPLDSVHDHLNIIKTLLANKADPNIPGKDRKTPLQLVIQTVDDYCNQPEYLPIIEELLAHGADPNMPDEDGKTPLQLVLLKKDLGEKNLKIVETLFANGVKPTEEDISKLINSESLHNAARYGHLKIIEILLANGVNVDVLDKYGETALQFAIKAGKTYIEDEKIAIENSKGIKALLAHGADPNIPDENLDTALHHAIGLYSYLGSNKEMRKLLLAKKKEVIELLLKHGAKPDIKNRNGLTPLHLAAFSRDSAVVRSFLDNGADPKIPNNDGNTLLHLAALEIYLNIVEPIVAKLKESLVKKLLAEKGIDITNLDQDKLQSLLLATESRKEITEGVKKFLNTQNKDGKTALYYTVSKGKSEVVRSLLDNGADPNIQGKDGNTPLQLILLKENLEEKDLQIVQTLLDNGVILTEQDILNSELLLYKAYKHGYSQIVEKLIANGVNQDILSKDGNQELRLILLKKKLGEEDLQRVEKFLASGVKLTKGDISKLTNSKSLLHNAARYGHSQTIKLLIANGVKPDILDKDGKTPMQVAVKYKTVESIKTLIECGADPNIKNNDGKTAMQCALELGNKEIAALLETNTQITDATVTQAVGPAQDI